MAVSRCIRSLFRLNKIRIIKKDQQALVFFIILYYHYDEVERRSEPCRVFF